MFRFTSVYHKEITGTVTIYLDNESIDVVPIITVTAETTITYNAKTVTLSAGTYTIDDFILSAGVNKVIISCTGGVTIEYQEGAI